MKNECFMVCRDTKIEIWNNDHEKVGTEELNEKVVSGHYHKDKEILMIGTSSGSVLQICDYDRLLKQYKTKNQVKEK